MERPWLILSRVVNVDLLGSDDDDDMDVDVEEHTVDGEAEADAQAEEEEEEEDAGIELAEEIEALVEALEAQDEQQAAVGEEAEEEEEEEDPQAQLEESVVNVNTDPAASQAAHAAHAAHGAGGPDFTITVAPPPWVSILIAGPGPHPDPGKPDKYPYIVATGRFCLLLHFSKEPCYGTNFDREPDHSHLVVVRHFLRDDDGQIAACAVPVPDRPDNDDDDDDFIKMPRLSNIQSVGLVCYQETGHYQIAELFVITGAPQAFVVYIRTDTGAWVGNYHVNPLIAVNRRRDWVPHGTVTINSTVCWFDLSWGIISCNLAQPFLHQVLIFHRLPPGCVLRAGAGAGALPDLHGKRCIAVSENLVRYVEIILYHHQEATVTMWHRDVEDNPWRWITNYSESFEDIWDDESYVQTGLPRNPPMLVGVSPVDSNVVYFSLDRRLFGVNVPEHTVVDCEEYEPLDRPGPYDATVTSRYLITWNLDPDGAINVGHHVPDEYSDHGDSSDSGPMDEGDIDYETPPE